MSVILEDLGDAWTFPNNNDESQFLEKLTELGKENNLLELFITPDFDHDFVNLFIYKISRDVKTKELMNILDNILDEMKDYTAKKNMENLLLENAIIIQRK